MLAGRLNILLLLLHSTSCRPWHFQHRLQHRYLRPARVGAERTTTDEDDAAFELLMATTLSEVLFTPNAAVDNSTVATPPPVDVEKAVVAHENLPIYPLKLDPIKNLMFNLTVILICCVH